MTLAILLFVLESFLHANPPAEDTAFAFAKSVEAAVAKEGPAGFDRFLNGEAFYALVTENVILSEPMVELLKPLILMTASSKALFAVGGEGFSYKFLRMRGEGQAARPLFRIIRKDGVVAYQELLLASKDGVFHIVDVFLINSGEWHSQGVRRTCVPSPSILRIANTLKAPLFEDFSKELRETPSYTIVELTKKRDPKAVLNYFDTQAALKSLRFAHVLRINAAAEINREIHGKAVEEMIRAFPDEPIAYLVSLSGYAHHGQYEKAIAAVDKVDRAVGGDPYLRVVRASLDLQAGGDIAKARALVLDATGQDPKLEQAWWTLVDIDLKAKSFRDVASDLKGLEAALSISIGDLTGVEGYADFVKSPEYAEWMRERKPAK
jgi:hypothetical protein